jgi:hypothetical protein
MFELFGIWHILIIIAPIAGLSLLIFFTRKLKREVSYKIGFWISVLAVTILVIRSITYMIWGYLESSATNFFARLFGKIIYVLPLQICHLANIIFYIAYRKKNNLMFSIGYTINLPAALLALVFAGDLQDMINSDTSYTFLNGFNIFVYIFGHSLLVIMPIYSLFHKHFSLNIKGVSKVVMAFGGLYLFFFLFDNLFNYIFVLKLNDFATANYFFPLWGQGGPPLSTFTEIGSSVWALDKAGGWFIFNPIYMLLTMLLGTIIVFAFYGVYILLDKAFNLSKYRRLQVSEI